MNVLILADSVELQLNPVAGTELRRMRAALEAEGHTVFDPYTFRRKSRPFTWWDLDPIFIAQGRRWLHTDFIDRLDDRRVTTACIELDEMLDGSDVVVLMAPAPGTPDVLAGRAIAVGKPVIVYFRQDEPQHWEGPSLGYVNAHLVTRHREAVVQAVNHLPDVVLVAFDENTALSLCNVAAECGSGLVYFTDEAVLHAQASDVNDPARPVLVHLDKLLALVRAAVDAVEGTEDELDLYPVTGLIRELLDVQVERPPPAAADDDMPDARKLSLLLGMVRTPVPEAVIEDWTPDQQELAWEWAGAVHARAADNPDVQVPPRPKFLPKPRRNRKLRLADRPTQEAEE